MNINNRKSKYAEGRNRAAPKDSNRWVRSVLWIFAVVWIGALVWLFT